MKDFDGFTSLTGILETINLYNGNSKGSNIKYTDMYRIADYETRKKYKNWEWIC